MDKSYRCAGCGNVTNIGTFICEHCGDVMLLVSEPTIPVSELERVHDDFSDSSIESFYELLEAIKLLVEDHR